MKRLAATMVTMVTILVLGCSQSYELRLTKTVDRMRYLQRLDQYLQPAVEGRFRELQIFLRPPKPLPGQPSEKGLVGLSAAPGAFDLGATFIDLSSAQAPPPGQGPNQPANAPSASPFRLHVVARVKTPPPGGAAKKAPAEAPPPQVERGEFVADVMALLSYDYGVGTLDSTMLETDVKQSNEYKRLIFQAPAGNNVLAYFYTQGDYDVALIWDYPTEMGSSSAIRNGVPLCLEIFAVGGRALRAFQGAVGEDDTSGGAGSLPGPGGGEAPGVTF